MNVTEWDEKYKPITNHLDEHASFNGVMFETYGEELEFVKTHQNKYIWTYLDGDDGDPLIVAGFHLFNRIGYFVTENEWDEHDDTTVDLEG